MRKSSPPKNSEVTAQKVKSMAARGFKPGQIAQRLEMSEDELISLYSHELDIAIPEIRAMAGVTLFQRAMAGDLVAIIFWLKIRAGWSEKSYTKSDAPGQMEAGPIFKQPPFMIPYLGCNARQGCMKATKEQILDGMLRVWPKALAKAERAGLDISSLLKLDL